MSESDDCIDPSKCSVFACLRVCVFVCVICECVCFGYLFVCEYVCVDFVCVCVVFNLSKYVLLLR